MSFPPFITLALLLVLTIISTSAEQQDTEELCLVKFPRKFYVTTGTTIPMRDAPPIAQSGVIYVDADAGLARIDQFHLGRQHSFITDLKKKRTYVLERVYVNTSMKGSNGLSCRVFSTESVNRPLCVPTGFARHADQYLVRGVPVTRHTGFDREEGRLLQADYYTLTLSLSPTGKANNLTIPWRIETQLRPNAELREIAGAPFTTPNWRYFGQPMFDELAFPATPQGLHKELSAWIPEYDAVTIDFYNFVPHAPDPNVFVVPQECIDAEGAWEEAKASLHSSEMETNTNQRGGKGNFRLSTTHRFLIEWSLAAVGQPADG